MSTPLLTTELYTPPPRPDLIPRPRLLQQLSQGLQRGHKPTLISAPAGFGKTTLLGAWLAACRRPAAWLSLDEGHKEPARFLAYLIAALQTAMPGIGKRALAEIQYFLSVRPINSPAV